MKLKNSFCILSLVGLMLISEATFAQKNRSYKVGNTKMYSARTIVDNLIKSEDNTTLYKALDSAKLLDTLKKSGPFTVFAPTDIAFKKLPEGTINTLLLPENRKTLQTILTYHVIASKVSTTDIVKAIKKGKGKVSLKTISGKYLVATLKDKKIILTDEIGGNLAITIPDIKQSNGVIHIVDTVALPKS